jgi:ribosomal protein S18 acetylase RimI-like enzyme
MNGISFRILDTPESLSAVRAIAEVIWPVTFAPILSPDQIKYMMNMMYAPEVMERELASGYRFEILQVNNKDAGYISYSPYEGHPDTAKLHKVYLLGEYHGRGLGQVMLDHAQDQCRKAGFAYIVLNVNKYNERAIKAYKRNGFEIADSVKNPIGNGYFMDDFVMKKKL